MMDSRYSPIFRSLHREWHELWYKWVSSRIVQDKKKHAYWKYYMVTHLITL